MAARDALARRGLRALDPPAGRRVPHGRRSRLRRGAARARGPGPRVLDDAPGGDQRRLRRLRRRDRPRHRGRARARAQGSSRHARRLLPGRFLGVPHDGRPGTARRLPPLVGVRARRPLVGARGPGQRPVRARGPPRRARLARRRDRLRRLGGAGAARRAAVGVRGLPRARTGRPAGRPARRLARAVDQRLGRRLPVAQRRPRARSVHRARGRARAEPVRPARSARQRLGVDGVELRSGAPPTAAPAARPEPPVPIRESPTPSRAARSCARRATAGATGHRRARRWTPARR